MPRFSRPSARVARRGPRFRPTVRRPDRQCAGRTRVRCRDGEARRAVLGRAAPDHPAEVAHLLEEPGQIRPADRDRLDAAARASRPMPSCGPRPPCSISAASPTTASRTRRCCWCASRRRPISRGPLKVAAEANWLVCEDVCIPEEGEFELTLPSGAAATPAPSRPCARCSTRRGGACRPKARGLRATAFPVGRADPTIVEAKGLKPDTISDVYFFPAEGGARRHHGEADRQRDGRRHPHPAAQGRGQDARCRERSRVRWC